MPIIDERVLHLYRTSALKDAVVTLFWGDEVASVSADGRGVTLMSGETFFARKPVSLRKDRLLKLSFIDVGQGDACLLESPSGKRILVDGGENQRLARYLAAKFRGSTATAPIVFDAMVVTHGDADHFEGLSILANADQETRTHKRIVVATDRVFHNGLVKRSATTGGKRRRDADMFGATRVIAGERCAVDLVDDVRAVPLAQMNKPFRAWANALDRMESRRAFVTKRLARGDDAMFSFFDATVHVEVLGPTTAKAKKGSIEGLPLFASAAQTINGHSIVLRLSYGSFRALLAADLHEVAEGPLVAEAKRGGLDLRAHVLKVPHHGSGDFAVEFLQAVRPTVSVVSAGDEDAAHEYIHPRANLIGALGGAGNSTAPVVFVTDLAAFDRYVGPALPARRRADGSHEVIPGAEPFYARERSVFGIVHVRTDGTEMFAGTLSGRKGRIEAYRYLLKPNGDAEPLRLDGTQR